MSSGSTLTPRVFRYFDHIEALRLYQKKMTDEEIANRLGCESSAISHWRRSQGLSPNSYSYNQKVPLAPPRSMMDNVVTAAFREVFGFCPFRDGSKYGAVKPIPKRSVHYDPVFGAMVDEDA